MFDIESSDIAVATLDVHYKFLSWSVKIRLFDLILKAFESIIRIQYFLEKPFFTFLVVQNYPVGPTIVFRINSVLVEKRGIVLMDYQYIEDGEYTVFGQQFDNNHSKIDFGDRIKVDL